jgi:cytochrome c biogenesis protein CcdA
MYDNPTRITYTYPALAFGGTSSSSTIKPPRNKFQGTIEEIHVGVTVLFTAVTTPAYVRLGYSGNNAYYAELAMGTAAASAGFGTVDITGATSPIFKRIDLKNDPTPGVLTAVLVNFVAATGGTPAGTGTVGICIGWY